MVRIHASAADLSSAALASRDTGCLPDIDPRCKIDDGGLLVHLSPRCVPTRAESFLNGENFAGAHREILSFASIFT